jgi:hypothetical protein
MLVLTEAKSDGRLETSGSLTATTKTVMHGCTSKTKLVMLEQAGDLCMRVGGCDNRKSKLGKGEIVLTMGGLS